MQAMTPTSTRQWMQSLSSLAIWPVLMLGLLVGTSVAAQDSGNGEIEEVIVTGSFIKGTPENAPNPVTTLDRDSFLQDGSPTIVEIIKNLGISSGVDGETNQFQSNGLEGAANINLRGLGPARTLTLLNGKRLPFSGSSVIQAGYQQFVDINLIPTIALRGVDFLREGASATYGSDAIAGVANFRTRNDFEGVEVSLNHRFVSGSEGWTEAGIAFGHEFESGSHLLLALGYNKRGELEIRDRDYTLRSYAVNPLGGWSGIGNPSSYLDLGGPTRPGLSFSDPGCVGFVGGIFDGTCRFQYTQFDNIVEDEERWQAYAEYEHVFDNDSKLTLSALYAETDVPEWKTSPAYPPASSFLANILPINHPGFVRLVNDVNAGNYEVVGGRCPVAVTDGGAVPGAQVWVPAAADGSCAAAALASVPTPSTDTDGMVTPATAVTQSGYFVNADGNVIGVDRTISPNPNSEINTIESGTGDAATRTLLIGRIRGFGATGPAVGYRKRSQYWLSADYEFHFKGIDAKLSASYGQQNSTIVGGDMLTQRFVWALNGLGGPECSPGQDPTTNPNAVAGQGNCQYYNPFSNSLRRATRGTAEYTTVNNPNYDEDLENSDALLDWLVAPTGALLSTELLSTDLVFTGNLFGETDWAAGVAFREDKVATDYRGFNNYNNYPCINEFERSLADCTGEPLGVYAFLAPAVPYTASETVVSVFGEVHWSLLDGRLQIQTAARFEEYSRSGDSIDPKVALRFDITDWLSVRASASTSFKAPQLIQSNLTNATSLSFIPTIRTFKAVDTSTVAGGLKPESAVVGNIGIILDFSDNIFATVDYWSLELDDPILNEDFNDIVATVCPGAPRMCDPAHALASRLIVSGGELEAGGALNAQPLNLSTTPVGLTPGSLNRVRIDVYNANKLETSGIDAKIVWNFSKFEVGAEFSHLLNYKLTAPNAAGVIATAEHAGFLNHGTAVRSLPKNKYRIFGSYNLATGIGDFRFGLSLDGIGKYEDQRPLVAAGAARTIKAYNKLDFNLLYTPNQGQTKLFVDIDNINDEEPPLAHLDISYDPYTHSPLGRTVKLGIVHKFTP